MPSRKSNDYNLTAEEVCKVFNIKKEVEKVRPS